MVNPYPGLKHWLTGHNLLRTKTDWNNSVIWYGLPCFSVLLGQKWFSLLRCCHRVEFPAHSLWTPTQGLLSPLLITQVLADLSNLSPLLPLWVKSRSHIFLNLLVSIWRNEICCGVLMHIYHWSLIFLVLFSSLLLYPFPLLVDLFFPWNWQSTFWFQVISSPSASLFLPTSIPLDICFLS